MDEAKLERAKAATISEDEAKEIGRNALHGARVLIDRANATGIEERRDEYQEHAADLMATADLARTVLVLHADLARLRAEHAAALDAARREGAEGMREAALRCCSPDDDHFDGFHAPDVWEQIEREIRALSLDAPGSAT